MRRRLRKRGLAALGVYLALWAATVACGPAAAAERQRAYEDAYYGGMGADVEANRTRLHGFVVPCPFLVLADWDAGGPPVKRVDYSKGYHRGVWVPGRYWVVSHRMTLVACGIVPPAEPPAVPPAVPDPVAR